ncbi:MAG: Dabb family protein [Lachnospiraceae bacterium]|nr:Dabb family protein [Lachnospiraceae bacterium]
MLKHVVLWKFKDGISDSEKDGIKNDIKRKLENLTTLIDGLNDVKVYTDAIANSDAEIMLVAELDNKEALTRYHANPEHQKIKDENIVPYIQARLSFDEIV